MGNLNLDLNNTIYLINRYNSNINQITWLIDLG
jgi:hypothetical protein